MTQEEITIPRWFLKRIEDTLRIQYNINLDKKTRETCQDRNIRESLNGVRKLLKGEELTGGERLERLQPSLLANLDEAANNQSIEYSLKMGECGLSASDSVHFRSGFKAGAAWRDAQIPKLPNNLDEASEVAYKKHLKESDDIEFLDKNLSIGMFKAGAKWMAEQGETHEHFVIREVADHDIGPAIVVYPDTFDVGDKVIVQIRKAD